MRDDRQHDRDEQEADAIDVRIDDADDPIQRVSRQRETEEIGDSTATLSAARQTRRVICYCCRPHVSFAVEADGAGMEREPGSR